MDNLSVFEIISNRMTDIMLLTKPPNVHIKFVNQKIFYAHKVVLEQLDFFKNIFSDIDNFEKGINDEIIIDFAMSSNDFLNMEIFSYVYDHLKNKILKEKDIHS